MSEKEETLGAIRFKNDFLSCNKDDVDFLLNLISKLQQENEELKAKYDKALTDLADEDNKIITLNKVIDRMVKTIMTYDIEEDICSRYGKSKDCNDFEKGEEYCINCIKEHFYKKVEKDKNYEGIEDK